MADFPIFVINLEGSDARLQAATAALHAQGATFTRHPAFDGRGKEVADLPHYAPQAALRSMGRALTGGEVGCFISHVEAAQQFLETGAPYGLVLEDDMHPHADALDLTRALIGHGGTWDLAHLAAETVKMATPMGQITAGGHQATLLRAHYFPMRTTALLWSHTGAKRFVAAAYPITKPVDIHLRHAMQNTDAGVAVAPAFFTTTEAASDITGGAGPKRGKDSRTALYTPKRILRTLREKARARALQHAANKGTAS